jgi:hypothetical protein
MSLSHYNSSTGQLFGTEKVIVACVSLSFKIKFPALEFKKTWPIQICLGSEERL